MIKLKDIKENELGGFFLVLGSIIILVTIFFEYRIGWIGVERTDIEVPEFMYDNWQNLKLIWGWQMLSHFVFIIAYLLILKNATAIMRTLWSVLMICSLMMLVAMGMTLGSYYPALEVYTTQPEIFDTIRGGIGSLYKFGRLGLIIFAFIFLTEAFGRNGKVEKITGLIVLGLILFSIALVPVTGISVKIIGATWFLIPLTIGYYYLRSEDF